MADLMLVDNDVLMKACCYNLTKQLLSLLSVGGGGVAGLGLARFVLKRKIEKSGGIFDRTRASAALSELLGFIEELEPDAAELKLAGQYEEKAQTAGYAFDSGESQLLAILVNRAERAIVTGDKRAIVAAWRLADELEMLPSVAGRFVCFEQVMLEICTGASAAGVAALVCTEPAIDKTMSICFGCSSQFDEDSMRAGLQSYADDLRDRSGTLLCTEFPV